MATATPTAMTAAVRGSTGNVGCCLASMVLSPTRSTARAATGRSWSNSSSISKGAGARRKRIANHVARAARLPPVDVVLAPSGYAETGEPTPVDEDASRSSSSSSACNSRTSPARSKRLAMAFGSLYCSIDTP